MYYKRKAEDTINKLIEAFASGNIAEPLSRVFVINPDLPMDNWSYLNKLVVILSGCTDARGFNQWKEVGRTVKKGQKAAANILIPIFAKRKEIDDDGNEKSKQFLIGFTSSPVFDISQTEGKAIPHGDHAAFINDLPLIEVAKKWDIDLHTFNVVDGKLAFYSLSHNVIGLGTKNAQTFLHELVHAADHRLGKLVLSEKNKLRNETVAELGALTLATILDLPGKDVGFSYDYIKAYAEHYDTDIKAACSSVVRDVCNCIALILETAK